MQRHASNPWPTRQLNPQDSSVAPFSPRESLVPVAPSLVHTGSLTSIDGPWPACYSWQPNMPFARGWFHVHVAIADHSRFIPSIYRAFHLTRFRSVRQLQCPLPTTWESLCASVVQTERASSMLLIASVQLRYRCGFHLPLQSIGCAPKLRSSLVPCFRYFLSVSPPCHAFHAQSRNSSG
jgi:hypothetical protein